MSSKYLLQAYLNSNSLRESRTYRTLKVTGPYQGPVNGYYHFNNRRAIVSSQRELEQFFAELERQLISVQRASELSGLAAGHIRYLLQHKSLAGVKLGRDWWTTAEAVEAYIKLERRPGPKTD